MNGQEIIEMARQVCDVTADSRGRESFDFDSYGLKAFAKLVATKEREACAKTVETIETYEKIEKACFKFAAKTIRERCKA